jgi:RNA polymerase sigma-70 factor (ECF subfamily)
MGVSTWQDSGVSQSSRTDDRLRRAQSGDGDAFRELTEAYRTELQVHCYRMLGSLQDAEDMVQETLLAAWRGVSGFEGRSSIRTWLYQIATNRCLNSLRAGSRRPRFAYQPEFDMPPPTRYGEVTWLEPYPDLLLDLMPDQAPGPDARLELKESISLAFITATQTLPPRQRAVLVLRDVLGYRAAEVAAMLETTEDSVNGALKRARTALGDQRPDRDQAQPLETVTEREVVERFVAAFEAGDVPAVVDLLSDDAWLTMPPLPLEYSGRAEILEFLTTIPFREQRRYRLIPTRANRQPAFACYVATALSPIPRAHGMLVLAVENGQIAAMTRFIDNSLMPIFGFPRIYPGSWSVDR